MYVQRKAAPTTFIRVGMCKSFLCLALWAGNCHILSKRGNLVFLALQDEPCCLVLFAKRKGNCGGPRINFLSRKVSKLLE